MFLEDVFFNKEGMVFCSDPNEDSKFEELVDPDISSYFEALGVVHFCVHNDVVKKFRYRADQCPLVDEKVFNLRDLTAKKNFEKIWTGVVLLDRGAPLMTRFLRKINKVPFLKFRDYLNLPYFINLVRYRILSKEQGQENQRAETIRAFLLRTVPTMKLFLEEGKK